MSILEKIAFGEGSRTYALQQGPIWFIIPMSILFALAAIFLLIYPDLAKRRWHVPVQKELVWVYGKMEGDEFGGRPPYRFITENGKSINLFCDPLLSKSPTECLQRTIIPHNEGTGPQESMAYYRAPTKYWHKNIIMQLSIGQRVLVSPFSQARNLERIAAIQDNPSYIGIVVGVPILAWALWMLVVKIVWYRN